MKLVKTVAALEQNISLRALLNPDDSSVRRVNRGRLNRLAGCWPKADADRITAFIEENCEAAHEGK
jgi:hypothetical protein